MAFHFNGNSILEEILLLSEQFWWKVSDTLLGILTIGGTPKIQAGVQKTVAAFLADAGGVVLKKLDFIPALGAFGFKDRPWFPISAVLSRAFHGFPPVFPDPWAKPVLLLLNPPASLINDSILPCDYTLTQVERF
jgi:hypothetical protein